MQIIDPDIQAHLDGLNNYFRDLHPELDHKTRLLGRLAKVMEELGELTNELMASLGFQKKSKLDKYTKAHLEEEFADTLISLLLLGRYLDIDINKIVSDKILHKYQEYELKS